MKKLLLLLPVLALFWSCGDQTGGGATGTAELATFVDSASYAQGMMMGKQIKDMSGDGEMLMSSAALKAGFDQAVSGGEGLIPENELQNITMQWQMKLQQAAQQQAQAKAAENKVKGAAFLAENANKEGVITTASGLQYKVIEEGSGPSPTAADKVKVNYRGTLIDGTEFDSSYKKGQPISFQVTGVIKGWTEALQLMKAGSKYQLYIPSELAYGERDTPTIPGGSTLIFDVELLEINPTE